MGIYRQIHIEKRAVITVWKITESEIELNNLINDPTIEKKAKSIKATTQRLQYLASQLLIQRLALRELIHKDENGKPHLSDNRCISISHDTHYVALMLADYKCGIDLQTISEKVGRIAPKFLDLQDCIQPSEGLFALTLAWSAKEALYKIHGEPSIFFKEHLRLIRPLTNSRLQCEINNLELIEKYEISYQKIDNILLCFTT
jgi:4'-phosphopantetheinyl transferase